MTLENCFNEHGDFVIYNFDPYRLQENEEEKALYDFLFDEDGYATRENEVYDLIKAKGWAFNCDAVRYYYAAKCIDTNCKGNYTAIFAWRHY